MRPVGSPRPWWPGGSNNVVGTGELYDPSAVTSTDALTATGNMATIHYSHTATRLPEGTVLVTGSNSSPDPIQALASAELYDPATGTWTSAGSMPVSHYAHPATLLNNGRVLVTGQQRPAPTELYDRPTSTWTSAGSMAKSRYFHTATLLANGQVLIVGGGADGAETTFAELYHP